MSDVWGNIQGIIKCYKFFISTYFQEEFLIQCNVNRAYEEMHVLAYVYHWDRNSLWNLPINERHKWVDIVLKQKQAENDSLEDNYY